MNASATNSLLNDLLVELYRSLVRYVHEVPSWKHAGDEPLLQAVRELAECQQENARSLFQLLSSRGEHPDLGVYPAEYTSLHFVSLDYLYDLMLGAQQGLVAELDGAAGACEGDQEALELVESIAAMQREGLEKLKRAAAAASAASPR